MWEPVRRLTCTTYKGQNMQVYRGLVQVPGR